MMSISIILDILLGIGGCLAMIGLGGTVAAMSRTVRNRAVNVTVSAPGHRPKVLAIPHDSPVFQQLAATLGISLIPSGRAPDAKASRSRRRRLDAIGLIAGLSAGAFAALPFVAEWTAFFLVGAALCGGFLTRLGEIISSVMAEFRSSAWHRFTIEERIRLLAALFLGEDALVLQMHHKNEQPKKD